MLTPVQTGSKLARSACGTRRNVRAAARWEIAGAARPPAVASAPAPTADFKNARRSMMCPHVVWCSRTIRCGAGNDRLMALGKLVPLVEIDHQAGRRLSLAPSG